MSSCIIKKTKFETEKIKISSKVKELEIEDLTIPRLIKIFGFDKNGNKGEWHLKITPKNKLALL